MSAASTASLGRHARLLKRLYFFSISHRACSDSTARQTLLESDLQLTNASLKLNPKNYSVWEHRKWVLETMPDADWGKEMKMVEAYLEMDARNCSFAAPRFISLALFRFC